MRAINTMDEAELLAHKAAFDRAMNVATAIFGDDAFRKRYRREDSRSPINKALFEAMAVNLSRIVGRYAGFVDRTARHVKSQFIELMSDRDFERSISQGTGDIAKVRLRFSLIHQMLRNISDDR